jgi:hypothetical protein
MECAAGSVLRARSRTILPGQSAALADEPSFHPSELERLAVVGANVDVELAGCLADVRKWVWIGLFPVRPQLAQEDVRGNRADAIEVRQASFEVRGIGSLVVQALEAALVILQELLAVPNELRGFPTVVTNVSPLSHDGVDKKVPSRLQNLAWR